MKRRWTEADRVQLHELMLDNGYDRQDADEVVSSLYPRKDPNNPSRYTKKVRCSDCGEYGKSIGHMDCQFPQNHS